VAHRPRFLDDLLQRGDQRLAHRVVQVVGLLDDQVEGLALLADEVLDPLQLVGVLGVGGEVPGHGATVPIGTRTDNVDLIEG
jgi:hypothetical protein